MAHDAKSARRGGRAGLWIAGALSVAVTAACYVSTGSSSQGATGGCGTMPSSCPSNVPSYASDVAPIMQAYCVSCHGPGGSVANKPLDSYAGVQKYSSAVGNLTSTCAMPPASAAAQPATADRDTILAWLACGAPDN
jgi:mono/diheme cytochrome c family protein